MNLEILIGPNGVGKTSYINKIEKQYNQDYKNNYSNFRLDNETLEHLHKGAKSLFNQKIKKLDDKLSSKTNIKQINEEAITLLRGKNLLQKVSEIKNFGIKVNENKYFQNLPYDIQILPKIEINKEIIISKWKFKVEGQEIDVKDAPSGVKRLVLMYLEIIDNQEELESKRPKLLIIEEIENYLHPSWIKICILLLENIFGFFKENDSRIIISTHNPEVVVLLKDYIDYFATPQDFGDTIRKIDFEKSLELFNEINSSIRGHEEIIDIGKYKQKVKTRLTFELARFIFSKDSPTILCEGITDQVFISKQTSKLVTNSYGYYNFGLNISLHFGLYGKINENLKIIADGDGKLHDKESNQSKLKQKLKEKIGEKNVFYFENCIEMDLYKEEKCFDREPRSSQKKFALLEQNYNKTEKELTNNEFWNFIKN